MTLAKINSISNYFREIFLLPLILFLISGAFSQPGNTSGQGADTANPSPEDTSFIAPESEFQTQKKKIKTTLQKTGKIIMETVEDLGNRVLGDSTQKAVDPEFLHQQVRREYEQQCKGIHVPTIKAAELVHKVKDTNYVFIDVREEKEQRVSMIPGALTPRDLAQKFRTPASVEGKTFVTYCTIGYRSGKYAEGLLAKRLKVVNLEGGVLAWSHEGGRFVKPLDKGKSKATREVHVYDSSWNFLHPDYTAVW